MTDQPNDSQLGVYKNFGYNLASQAMLETALKEWEKHPATVSMGADNQPFVRVGNNIYKSKALAEIKDADANKAADDFARATLSELDNMVLELEEKIKVEKARQAKPTLFQRVKAWFQYIWETVFLSERKPKDGNSRGDGLLGRGSGRNPGSGYTTTGVKSGRDASKRKK